MNKWNQSRKQIIDEVTKIKLELLASCAEATKQNRPTDEKILLGKAVTCNQIICMLSELKVSKSHVITNGENKDVSDGKQKDKIKQRFFDDGTSCDDNCKDCAVIDCHWRKEGLQLNEY